MSIPQTIIRQSGKWYRDGVTGKWIHKDKLQAYVEAQEKQQTELSPDLKHEQIASKRWDLKY